jgi:nitrile hydratase
VSFAIGAFVRTRADAPAGHHRLPRYLRGKRGRIEAHHGAYPLADARAAGLDAPPEALYTVGFAGTDVWGVRSDPYVVVHADLWESYLAPA